MPRGLQKTITVHNGISATVTAANSVVIPMDGVRKATIFLTTAGSWTLNAEVSGDGTNFATLNKLVSNVTNSNAQTLTRVATSGAITSTDFVSVDMTVDAFKSIRIGATRSSGNATVTLVLEYF